MTDSDSAGAQLRGLLKGMLSPAWQRPSVEKIQRLLRQLGIDCHVDPFTEASTPRRTESCTWCGANDARGQCAPCAALLEAIAAVSPAGAEAIFAATRSARLAHAWRQDEPPRGMRCLVSWRPAGGDARVALASVSPDHDGTVWFSQGTRLHGVVAWMPCAAIGAGGGSSVPVNEIEASRGLEVASRGDGLDPSSPGATSAYKLPEQLELGPAGRGT